MYALLYTDVFKTLQVLNQDARNNRKLKGAEGNYVDCMPGNEFRYLPAQWNSFERPSMSDYCVDSHHYRLINEHRSLSVEYIKSRCDIKMVLSILLKEIARQSTVILSRFN